MPDSLPSARAQVIVDDVKSSGVQAARGLVAKVSAMDDQAKQCEPRTIPMNCAKRI